MIWIIHLAVIILSYLLSKNNWRKFFPFTLIIFTLIYGQRWMVGTDFPNYLNFYLKRFERFEFFYFGIQNFFRDNNLSFGLFILLITFLTLFNFYKLIKKFEKKNLILSIFLISEIFFAAMSQIRQYLAISLIVNAIYYSYNNKYLRSLFFTIIAVFFHKSAIIVSPLLFRIKPNRMVYLILLISAFIFPLIDSTVLLRSIMSIFDYDSYIGGVFDKQLSFSHYLRYYVTLILIIFYIFLYKYDSNDLNNDVLLINMVIIYIILYGLSIKFAPLYRVTRYLSLYEIIFFVELSGKLKYVNTRNVISIISLLYILIFIGIINSDSYNISDFEIEKVHIFEKRNNIQIRNEVIKGRIKMN